MLSRASELGIPAADAQRWAAWACAEADRIDPIKNRSVVESAADLARAIEPSPIEDQKPVS